VRLPVPEESEFDYQNSLDARFDGLKESSNAAISFARECLRLDPAQRPSAADLLKHDYFNEYSA